MTFDSVTFLFYFLPCFLAVYFLTGRRDVVLLIGGLVFYAWGSAPLALVLPFFLAAIYATGLSIGKNNKPRKGFLVFGILLVLAFLAYFKYAPPALAQSYAPEGTLRFLLPFGVSIIALQSLSYLVDVFRKEIPAERDYVRLAARLILFPQAVLGPVVRYREITGRASYKMDDLYCGARRFIIGLAQKVLIADTLAFATDQIFALQKPDLGMATAWFALITYAIQIYFDFCGYANMAIGLGRILGFTYPENFDRPYAAQSVSAFWMRWMMTVSQGFRDYLYIPVKGKSSNALRHGLAVLLTFVAGALCFGAMRSLIVWALYHAFFVLIEKAGFENILKRVYRPLRHFYCLSVVTLGWVFFRFDHLGAALSFFGTLRHGKENPVYPVARFATPSVMLALVAAVILLIVPFQKISGRMRGLASATFVLLLALSLLSVANSAYIHFFSYNPFTFYPLAD